MLEWEAGPIIVFWVVVWIFCLGACWIIIKTVDEIVNKRKEEVMDGKGIKVFVGMQCGGTEPSQTGTTFENLPIEKLVKLQKALAPELARLEGVIIDALNK